MSKSPFLLNEIFIVPGDIQRLFSFNPSFNPKTPESSQETNSESHSSSPLYVPAKGGREYKKNDFEKINIMTEEVVEVFDDCQISYRKSVRIIAVIAQALNFNLETLILNLTSFYQIRKNVRKKKAEKIKQLFEAEKIDHVTVHWDGKLLSDSKSDVKKDRVPILATAGDLVQILNVPQLDHSTGVLQADEIFSALKSWNLETTVEAVCCDTTNSNLGSKAGAAVILERKLKKDLLYMPCRHHILELLLKAIFTAKVSSSTEPEVPEFKKFKKEWNSLDTSEPKSGIEDLHPSLVPEIDQKMKFIESYLLEKHPRDDYKELLELALLFLGKKNKNFTFKKPGPCHHARWMGKAIYVLKMYLNRNSYNLEDKVSSFFDLCQFIVFIYIEAWFTSTLPIKAPNNDLQLIKKLEKYQNIDNVISNLTLNKIKLHLWYLSPECSALSFFDNNISVEVKKKMVKALENDNFFRGSTKKFPKEKLNVLFSEEMDYFISNESLDFFERFKIKKEFLELNPSCWDDDEDYIKSKNILSSLRVVNDVSERAVKLATDYNNKLTTDEEQRQYLYRNVAHFKKTNTGSTKEKILKRYKASEGEN